MLNIDLTGGLRGIGAAITKTLCRAFDAVLNASDSAARALPRR